MRVTPVLLLTTATAAAVVTATAAPAGAKPAPHAKQLKIVKPVSSGQYLSPLQFAVAGKLLAVADSFPATLSLNLHGHELPVASSALGKGSDLSGVAFDPKTLEVAYTTTSANHHKTTLTIARPGGKKVVANLAAFERKHNPDGKIRYGIDVRHPNACITGALKQAHIPVHYKGQLDSHPYAVTSLGNGSWAVADAGANDVLKVDRKGHVSLLSVAPRQALKITKAFAQGMGLPSCVAGHTYYFEAVPTDVETNRAGHLFITTLPGGTGASGSVYKINARTGKMSRVATGFHGATNLAIDNKGRIYVAEIGSGTIAQVVHGKRVKVMDLPAVVSIEFGGGHLYAATSPAATTAEEPGSGSGGAPTGPPAMGSIYLLRRA